jgi:uncharacterized protein (TIGR02217 family)
MATFPVLIGQGWSVTKTPIFQTRVQRAVSGRELRALDYPYPLWRFTLTFNYLPDATSPPSGSPGNTDLRNLMGFFMVCQGAYNTFTYWDPSDNTELGQGLGTGDGSTTVFQLQRGFGFGGVYFQEPITEPNAITAIYFNGVAQSPSIYSLGANGLITFTTAPGSGVDITADFNFYFLCRFVDDSADFEQFMSRISQLKKLSFISVRP